MRYAPELTICNAQLILSLPKERSSKSFTNHEMDPSVFCTGFFGFSDINGSFTAEADRYEPFGCNAFSD
jgi:hypothetical protein